MNGCSKTPLVYVLHSGNLYGTERMALYTAEGLAAQFEPVILAPNGLAIQEAHARGFRAFPFESAFELSARVRALLSQHRRLAFISTGVVHSLVCLGWNLFYGRRVAHMHLVHGGASENLSYGRKKILNHFPVQFVAVSQYVRQRLVAHGVDEKRVQVIENFLPKGQVTRSGRPPFQGETPHRITVISRLDPEKRISLLLDALEQFPDLRSFEFRIYGLGSETASLKERAAKNGLPIAFEGFHPDTRAVLAESDLLLHLCPVEPFGLAIIEAMAAGVPVLVPDTGGAALLVENDRTGFRFKANDAAALAQRLREVAALKSDRLNQIAAEARRLHQGRFSADIRITEYERLLVEGIA